MIPNAITSSATLQSPQSQSMAEFSSKEEREDSLSLIIGIASLVLEGRPIGDEYETLPPSKRDEKNVQQAKYEKYGNIFSELTSPSLPCTSRVQVAKSSMSNALNKTAQKLYQLRQAENGVGRKGCGASVNHQYTMQSIPNNFHEENECADRTKNINDDYSGFFYTLQSLASSCLQSGQSATNTSLGQTVHSAVHLSKNIDENNPHSSRERYCNAASNIDMKTLLAGSRNINNLISSKITTNELEPKRRTQRLTMPSLLPAQLQQGPHCDQFLKKIGLCKSETTETYEHYCDMSYLNITCSRWKAYCLKIEAIIKRGLPVCIEVYLGPVTHKILLEQWILQINERAISPTMTLPSLCSAIRSQLYFSQISAWCDLIKKCENSVAESGRVIYGRSNNSAGDLIQIPQTNFASTIPSTQSHPFPKVCASVFQRPRLNIFYRLRPYDSTASFISKPRIHNFPNVNVTENFSISVCLKSLPRLNGGIPKVGKVANNLTDSLSAQIFTDKKNTSCTISNSNSFNNTAPLDKPPPPTTSNKEQSTKICDKTMFNSTITIEDYINTVSKDITTNSQNSSDDNNVFLSKTQNFYDLKSESDCSNSLDGLSHREKQLLKYKKRMQKRDKQLRSYFKTSNSCFTQCALPTNQFELDGVNNRNLFQKDSKISNSNLKESTATSTVTKVSIGTQTQQMCCKQCGNEKSLLCLTCENHANNSATTNETETDIEPMTMLSSNKSKVNNNEENMPELLLEATQRSPQSLRLKKKCSSVDPIFTIKSDVSQQNNNHNSDSSNSIITEKGCRLCKRQKTQHTYVDHTSDDTALVQQQDQDLLDKLEIGKNNYRDYDIAINVPKADSNLCKQNTSATAQYENRMEPVFKTPTEDEQHMKNNVDQVHTINYLTNLREQSNDEFRPNLLVARLKNSSESQEATPPLAMCIKSKIVRKSVPKINLTPIFCKSPQSSMNEQYWKSITSPVSIDLKDVVPSSSKTAYPKIENSAKIQKSNSAPTLPNTLTVSPRFPKQFNTNKGRSRHISDRSDRSSLCSDEMFSDEECESYAFSPSTSPNKKRYNYFSQNRRLPLLGNLEESLLQKRFIPKMEVVGFKVLLGASGGFCPTQLTIPASSYFYELQSQDISTPYICEIRLPRKGYVVPRSGTVQVTLLNPTGTVVRMFVVPYDMRDMPPLHTTFVRQRILADTNTKSSKNTTTPTTSAKDNRPMGDKDDDKIYFRSSTNTNNQNYEKEFGYFISPEHMKRLRYCIHLKFQTSRSGRLLLHTDIRLLISRRTDCDTAIAHAKGALESSSDLLIQTFMPENPTYSMRQENLTKL